MSETVATFSSRLATDNVILRAITFDHRLTAVWSVPVMWNWRLKSSAGFARINPFQIELHPGLNDATPHDLRTVFLHELAHICQHILYPECTMSHGYEWHEAMIRLGERPIRTHNIAACKSAGREIPTLDEIFGQQP
jgi:predicted SprT family Zn-dependent metalloprotease